MKCREARRLIYLFRENEMPEESRRQLLQHAGSCKRCARELQEAEGARLFLSECQSMEPELKAGHDITEQIMRSVEQAPTIRARSGVRWEFPSFRRLQFGCTLAAAAIATVFFLQNISDFTRIAQLESRLSRTPNLMPVTPEEPHLAAVGFSAIAEISRFLTPSPSTTTPELQGRLRLKENVRSFSDLLEQGPPGFVGEVRRLRMKYPEIWMISPLNGLTANDRRVLSRQGKSFIKDLRQLLQPGNSDYEK
jgi:hypothetical protein